MTQHDPVDIIGEERRTYKVSASEAFFNAQFDAQPVDLYPGQSVVLDQPDEMIVSSIGDGIGIIIHDPFLKKTGMAYIMMADSLLGDFPFFKNTDPALIENSFIPFEICMKAMCPSDDCLERLQIRLTGGNNDDKNDSGTKTAVFTKEYLARKGIKIMSQDIGGEFIRRIHIMPQTGHVIKRILRRKSDYAYIQDLKDSYNAKFTDQIS